MLEVGLTGGIATGKSTVAEMFLKLGAHLVDTDHLAREVVLPGSPGLEEVAAAFGPEVIGPDGGLDRRGLRDRVFGHPERLARLNGILHPRIRALVAERLAEIAARDPEGVALVDVPLLFEVKWQDNFPLTILVYAPARVQAARLMARDRVDDKAARAALASQMPIEDKRKLANFVIDNSGAVEETRLQVERVWRELTDRARSGSHRQ